MSKLQTIFHWIGVGTVIAVVAMTVIGAALGIAAYVGNGVLSDKFEYLYKALQFMSGGSHSQ